MQSYVIKFNDNHLSEEIKHALLRLCFEAKAQYMLYTFPLADDTYMYMHVHDTYMYIQGHFICRINITAGYYKLHQHKEKVSKLAKQDCCFANTTVTYKLGSMEDEMLQNLASNYNFY